ncbi:MAG: endonuclease [Bacteroidales bacterium]
MNNITQIKHQLQRLLLLLIVVISFPFYTVIAQIPPTYYNNAVGLSGLPLKTALYNIIKGHTSITYNQLYTSYTTTDNLPGNKVWDMYSIKANGTANYYYTHGSLQCGSYNSEGDCYNREHSTPASWINNAYPMYSDLFNVYPTDGYVNNRRSNYPLANVATASWTSSNGTKLGSPADTSNIGSVFEPIDSFKGDFARTFFYMATRYENVVATWHSNSPQAAAVYAANNGLVFKPWYITMLLSWCALDPVSQKEINRNNAVYAIQNNRNPYIDHPEYINAIWGGGSNIVKPEPTNYPTHFTTKNFQLQWTDATGGVLPDHYLIRMSTTGFSSITDPVDGTTYVDSATDRNVAYGVQNAWYYNLNPNTTYYFKLYGYKTTGTAIDYKTDGTVPQVSQLVQ